MSTSLTQTTSPAERPLAATHASEDYVRLARASNEELLRVMVRGQRPDPDALDGWMFRGTNTPGWAKLLGIKKFVKGFYRGVPRVVQRDGQGPLFGYNAGVRQNSLEQPWVFKPHADDPKPFGFYSVTDVDATAQDNEHLNALLLNYGEGDNPLTDPSKVLRDYIVCAYPGRDDILLGHAFAALGPKRIGTNFFVLERMRRY